MAFTEAQRIEIENVVATKLNSCRAEVDERVNATQKDIHQLRVEVHAFRTEFIKSSENVSAELSKIASAMERIADLPDAWANFKGFLGFVRWVKENVLAVAIMVALGVGSVAYIIKAFGI
jgi:hypothetical protein